MKIKHQISPFQTQFFYDSVTIYDGPNDQSNQIEKLSGNLEIWKNGIFSISSTGNSIFVKFESDNSGQYKGFRASIQYGNLYSNIN